MKLLLCVGAVLVLTAGCGGGSGQADLTGEVTLDGKPLPSGSLLLVPLDQANGSTAGGEIKDGRFSLTGKQAPRLGEYKVEVHSNKPSGKKVQKAMGKPGELDDEMVEAVAPRFNTKTELKVEVKSGGSTAKFEVLSR